MSTIRYQYTDTAAASVIIKIFFNDEEFRFYRLLWNNYNSNRWSLVSNKNKFQIFGTTRNFSTISPSFFGGGNFEVIFT